MFRLGGRRVFRAAILLPAVLLPAVLVALSCIHSEAWAQLPAEEQSAGRTPEEAARALEEVRAKIEREQEHLAELRARERSIRAGLEKLKQEGEQAVARQAALAEALTRSEARETQLEEGIEKAQSRIEELRRGLDERIIAIYKTYRRTSSLDYLLRATSTTNLLQRARYLEAVARFDRSFLDKLTDAVVAWEGDRKQLVELKREQAAQLEEVERLKHQLEAQRVQQAALLREERAKATQREEVIAKLQASADRLEGVIAAVTGSESIPGEVRVIAAITRGRSASPAEPPPPPPEPFTGKGLQGVKGKLDFPVPGKILQRFGKQQHEEFADILFVKGLEVAAAVGTRVKAVAPGKVIFDRALPGYGNVLIVDHGERYYTLYGRIERSLFTVGDFVSGGQEIAVLGEPDRKGRNFYFELRIRGKAQDPTKFFRELPVAVSG